MQSYKKNTHKMRKKWEKNHLHTNRDKRYNNVTEQYSKANSITALPMRTKSWSQQFKFECIFITSLVHRNRTVVQFRQFVCCTWTFFHRVTMMAQKTHWGTFRKDLYRFFYSPASWKANNKTIIFLVVEQTR